MIMLPGESICGLERVARAKGGVEGGVGVALALLEGGVRCRAAEGSSVGEHAGAAVISVGKIVFQSKLNF